MIAAQPKPNYQLVASTAETFFGTSIEAAVSCVCSAGPFQNGWLLPSGPSLKG